MPKKPRREAAADQTKQPESRANAKSQTPPKSNPKAKPKAKPRTTRSAKPRAAPRVGSTGEPQEAAAEAPSSPAPRGEKLQKVLARTGLGSRREMEAWIEAGRILVNGRPATLGDRIGDRAKVTVDGKLLDLAPAQETRCILYHKPTGEVCSRKDPEDRPTVFAHLPKLKAGRWISIGRLDFNTTGLLLFTTDGELANALMHPSANIEREYMVRVMGEVDADMLARLCEGVMLEDGLARFTDVQAAGGEGINRWFYVTLMEGRNREVRRLWESQGLTVSRLKRVRYGDVFIPSRVKQGQWVELERKDVKSLYRMADIPLKSVKQGTMQEREVMDRQFGKRHGRGVAKKPKRAGPPRR